jgi:hypothetical protein
LTDGQSRRTMQASQIGNSTMADTLEQLAERACALSLAQRAALAELLLASLDEGPNAAEVLAPADSSELEAVWDHELRQRIARFERGETESFPAADVFAEARRRPRRG